VFGMDILDFGIDGIKLRLPGLDGAIGAFGLRTPAPLWRAHAFAELWCSC